MRIIRLIFIGILDISLYIVPLFILTILVWSLLQGNIIK